MLKAKTTDQALAAVASAVHDARLKREAARLAAQKAFSGEPLEGVGGEKVRELDVERSNLLFGLSVFLCHSSKDKAVVRELYRKLALNGAKPWLDEEDLLPGQKWEDEITRAVRRCDAVIVCMSKNAVSKTGYFHKEISFALDVLERQPENTIYLIPVRFDDCEVPERLQRLHYVNIADERGYTKLLRSLVARANQLQLGLNPTTLSPAAK